MSVAAMFAVLRRELVRAARSQTEALYPLIFFALCVLLFPFAIGTEGGTLRDVAPGAIWVSVLLAATLSVEHLFRADYADGTLELLAASGTPLVALALGKAVSHWVLSALPILAAAVPLGLALDLGLPTLRVLLASLALGTLTLSLVGAAVGALTVGLRGGGVLLALLILPLYIPVLIFGGAAAANAAAGLPATAELLFLAGLAVLALTLAPWATAAALRIRLG